MPVLNGWHSVEQLMGVVALLHGGQLQVVAEVEGGDCGRGSFLLCVVHVSLELLQKLLHAEACSARLSAPSCRLPHPAIATRPRIGRFCQERCVVQQSAEAGIRQMWCEEPWRRSAANYNGGSCQQEGRGWPDRRRTVATRRGRSTGDLGETPAISREAAVGEGQARSPAASAVLALHISYSRAPCE